MLIDLHAHSTASDGTDSPAELIEAAVATGLRVLGITDHDTTASWSPAEAALPDSLSLVRGTEFSTRYTASDGSTCSVHLLGYLYDPDDPAIVAEHRRLHAERLRRGVAIVDRLVADGVPITSEQVLELAAGAPVGRPHIGKALVTAGVVPSVSAAFSTYLSHNSRYYVAKADTPVELAIRMIKAAGGVSVVAHCRSRGAARVLTAARLGEMAMLGLDGIEVDHPDHSRSARAELSDIAGDLGLIRTGSSDYHGTNKVLRLGQETTHPEELARLIAASSGRVPVVGPLSTVA